MGNNPSHFVGSMRPVEKVSWCNAVIFCNKLSLREGLNPCYDLPEGLEISCRNHGELSEKPPISTLYRCLS